MVNVAGGGVCFGRMRRGPIDLGGFGVTVLGDESHDRWRGFR